MINQGHTPSPLRGATPIKRGIKREKIMSEIENILKNNEAVNTELLGGLSELSKLVSSVTAQIGTAGSIGPADTSREMLLNFERMFTHTLNMLGNMGLMDSGFGKLLGMLADFISSFAGGKGGAGIFGTITSLITSAIGLFSGAGGLAVGSLPVNRRLAGNGLPFNQNQATVNNFLSRQEVYQPKISVYVESKIGQKASYKIYNDGKLIASKRGTGEL
jgi:hypothetical protein